MEFSASSEWLLQYPKATAALMVVDGVRNPGRAEALEPRLESIERDLRTRFAGFDRSALRATPPFNAYDRYYRQFGQNYHVLHQVESVAFKGKAIPRRAALIEAAFAEELESGLLTAMHDADAIGELIVVDVATGAETVTLANGSAAVLKPGDMYMRDEHSVLTSVILGPTAYGLVRPSTERVAVCVYAPVGIGAAAVARHLDAIASNVRALSEQATVQFLAVIEA